MMGKNSDNFRGAVLILLTVLVTYCSVNLGLNCLARWAENRGDTFPYLPGEEGMRYLLPELVNINGQKHILIAGESAAGDEFMYEDFNKAFPDRQTYPGAISAATLDDILVLLEFLEKQYGQKAIPKQIVLGISVRFIANLPRRFGANSNPAQAATLFNAINHYSARYCVVPLEGGSRLSSKAWIEGRKDMLRFWLRKQQPRQLAALMKLTDVLLHSVGVNSPGFEQVPKVADFRRPYRNGMSDVLNCLRSIKRIGLFSFMRLWLKWYCSPYYTLVGTPQDPEWLNRQLQEPGMWRRPYSWDINEEENLIKSQLRRLLAWVSRHEVRLYVINLPENSVSKRLYDEDKYNRYLSFIKKELGDVPFLDLRDFLKDSEFFDDVHPLLDGAKRTTARVIQFMQEEDSH